MNTRAFCVSRRIAIIALLCAVHNGGVVLAPPAARADAPPAYELNGGWIPANLKKMTNKKVTVRLLSGEELTGTVLHVGGEAMQLGALSGRDFYDALIRLDQIAAIIFNTKVPQ